MCIGFIILLYKKIPGYPGTSRFYMDKIPGFLIPGSGVLSYPGIKKSQDWNFQKIPALND